jgi:dihydroflavonol-4-reductase
MRLTTINPSLVLGVPLDAEFGTSLQLIERILSGKDPMQPDIGFGIVDVADVSAMHVRALDRPGDRGQALHRLGSLGDDARDRAAPRAAPSRPPDRDAGGAGGPAAAPGLFDRSIKTALPALGRPPSSTTPGRGRNSGIDFTDWQTAVDRAADAVVALKR